MSSVSSFTAATLSVPVLSDTEVRLAQRLLALRTQTDDQLRATAEGIAPSVGQPIDEVERTLRVFREVLALGALQEKLEGRP